MSRFYDRGRNNKKSSILNSKEIQYRQYVIKIDIQKHLEQNTGMQLQNYFLNQNQMNVFKLLTFVCIVRQLNSCIISQIKLDRLQAIGLIEHMCPFLYCVMMHFWAIERYANRISPKSRPKRVTLSHTKHYYCTAWFGVKLQ